MHYSRLAFAILLLGAACPAQTPANVTARLSLVGDQAVFKIGEPILLNLTFHADTAVTVNWLTTDTPSPIDQLVVEPMTGVFNWLADQNRGQPYVPDYATAQKAEPGKPVSVKLTLNAIYRFDAPGHYSVHAVTRRVLGDDHAKQQQAAELITNSVSFEIQAMTEEEEAQRAAELEQKARQARKLDEGQRFATQLNWLTGEPSTRAKLSLVLKPKEFYPFALDVNTGLWIARNRRMVVEQLEAALRDPSQELGAGSPVLATAAALRARLESPNSAGPVDMAGVELSYVKEIVASLPHRSGKSFVTAAQTAFTWLPRVGATASPEFAAAREAMITHFGDVNEYNVDWLLNSFGKYLEDPRLVPALRQILATAKDPIMNGERTAVLKQLMKIAPEDSRADVVKEVCADNPTFTEVLGAVPFSTLPETDACLRQKIRALTDALPPLIPAENIFSDPRAVLQPGGGAKAKPASGNALVDPRPRQMLALQWASQLAARFASAAIYDDLFSAYERSGTGWDKQAQGHMLAYLAKWNPERAMPLLEAAVPVASTTPDTGIAYALGQAGYIPAVDLFWRERLAGSPTELAMEAGYQMRQNGPKEDQALLRGRLEAWRLHWKGREIPPVEVQFEVELTQTVMHGANWQMSKDDMSALAAGCVTDVCRTRFGGR
jgi:hypothetical protein